MTVTVCYNLQVNINFASFYVQQQQHNTECFFCLRYIYWRLQIKKLSCAKKLQDASY